MSGFPLRQGAPEGFEHTELRLHNPPHQRNASPFPYNELFPTIGTTWEQAWVEDEYLAAMHLIEDRITNRGHTGIADNTTGVVQDRTMICQNNLIIILLLKTLGYIRQTKAAAINPQGKIDEVRENLTTIVRDVKGLAQHMGQQLHQQVVKESPEISDELKTHLWAIDTKVIQELPAVLNSVQSRIEGIITHLAVDFKQQTDYREAQVQDNQALMTAIQLVYNTMIDPTISDAALKQEMLKAFESNRQIPITIRSITGDMSRKILEFYDTTQKEFRLLEAQIKLVKPVKTEEQAPTDNRPIQELLAILRSLQHGILAETLKEASRTKVQLEDISLKIAEERLERLQKPQGEHQDLLKKIEGWFQQTQEANSARDTGIRQRIDQLNQQVSQINTKPKEEDKTSYLQNINSGLNKIRSEVAIIQQRDSTPLLEAIISKLEVDKERSIDLKLPGDQMKEFINSLAAKINAKVYFPSTSSPTTQGSQEDVKPEIKAVHETVQELTEKVAQAATLTSVEELQGQITRVRDRQEVISHNLHIALGDLYTKISQQRDKSPVRKNLTKNDIEDVISTVLLSLPHKEDDPCRTSTVAEGSSDIRYTPMSKTSKEVITRVPYKIFSPFGYSNKFEEDEGEN